ncbi:MAG TPA: hypothetical protein VN213_12035, partial [Solirubrobacteraceae bacterium]|nr:hypothetical protein [Solirubrobacteraceae bacterium]
CALARIAARLPDDGRLFLGAGEALPPGIAHVAPERVGSAYVYRPVRSASPSGPAPAPPPPPARDGARAPAVDETRMNLSLARARVLRDGER